MKNLSLSVIPSYFCKTNCNYCYLQNMRSDATTLDLQVLTNRLEQLISAGYNINDLTIYGGEISLLPQDYIDQLIAICKQYCSMVGVVSNCHNRYIIDLCTKHDVGLMISLNEERPDYKRNKRLIEDQRIHCTVGVVVLPSVIKRPISEFVQYFDSIGKDVFLFEYYQTKADSDFKFDVKTYTDWILHLLQYYNKTQPHNFKIINVANQKNNQYNSNDDGFVFINPYGQLMTTVYDNNQLESYKTFKTIADQEQHCKRSKLQHISQCHMCEFYNKCIAEHLVVYDGEYCSGLKKVIQFLKK